MNSGSLYATRHSQLPDTKGVGTSVAMSGRLGTPSRKRDCIDIIHRDKFSINRKEGAELLRMWKL